MSHMIVKNKKDGTTKTVYFGRNGKDGERGNDGDDGLSAYQLAVQEGYEGTLAEWLESLKGADGTTQLTPLFANSVDECTDKTKFYVLPDGYIYQYGAKTETSTGAAYTNVLEGTELHVNYRWSLSSAKYSESNGMVTTDKIPVTSGQKIRVNQDQALLTGGYARINYYNSAGTNLSSDGSPAALGIALTTENGVTSWDVGYYNGALASWHGSIAYMLVSFNVSYGTAITGKTTVEDFGFIMTIDEEIKETTTTTTTEGWVSTGHAFIPAGYEDMIIALKEDVKDLKKNGSSTTSTSSLLDGMSAFAPSPQLPADGSAGADFNADPLVIDCDQIYNYIAPFLTKYPRYITKETMGKDASGTYDWNRYICCRHYYSAWRPQNRMVMYAWVNAGTTVYAASVSPRIGDTVYTTPYIGTAYATVTAVDNANQTRTINGLTFSRDKTQDVKPELIFTESHYNPNLKFEYPSSLRRVYNSAGSSINHISDDGWEDSDGFTYSGDTLTDINGNVYVRYPFGDRDKNFKKFPVIVLGANEHGTGGDPAIPAIIKARMIKDLCETTNAQNPFLNLLKNNYMIVFCPIINPWGFSKTNRSYYNSNGVNIDRNFDTPGWGADVCGAYGGSEIETQYFMNTLVESGATIALANHSLGNGIDTSIGESPSSGLCHYMFGRNKDKWKEDLGKIAMTMSANYNLSFTDYGQAPPESWAKTRSYMDWIGIEGGAIEMQSREGFVSAGEGAPYTARVMEGAYTQMLQVLCMLMDKNSNSV